MFKHLLIPLDGSRRAASALPAGAALAGCLGATVTLLHVVEKAPPEKIHGETHIRSPEEAAAYLEQAARGLASRGIEVRTHVHSDAGSGSAGPVSVGGVAAGIVEHEQEFRHDLIVMCTHGAGGATRFLLGSIAQQVVAAGTKPVLLIVVRDGGEDARISLSPILVPLDGTPGHEQALEPAAGLASACRGAIHLLMVVPERRTLKGAWTSTGKLLPSATSYMLDMLAESGTDYLARKKESLEKRHLDVRVSLERGDPAGSIAGYIRSHGIGLTALGTHGTRGMSALLSSSVASAVVASGSGPFLLVPGGTGPVGTLS